MTAPLANAQRQREALGAASSQRSSHGNLLYRYIFWTYERGSLHYDVMVTLILLFLFIAPHLIDFHDRPNPEVPGRSSEVLVRTAGAEGNQRRFIYEIRAEDLHDIHSDNDLRSRVSDKVAEIAPDAQIREIKPVKDPRGRTVAYDATVLR